MERKYTPEEALIKIMHLLKYDLKNEPVIRIVPAGSVPLGTYIDIPDLDIFIETKDKKSTFRTIRKHWHRGMEKIGELLIWHVPSAFGYPIDFVVIGEGEEKTQTLKHVEYFMSVLDDGARHRVKEMKALFKRINCYGAETGGITGVCITTMAVNHPSMNDALEKMMISLLMHGTYFVEDPVLKDRNLFASVMKIKKRKMLQVFGQFGLDNIPVIDIDYLFDEYLKVYVVKRKRRMGTDKEWQFVNSSIRKTWKEMRGLVKWWNPSFDYDTLVTDDEIYIAYTIHPMKITSVGVEKIPYERLNKKAIRDLTENPNATLFYNNDNEPLYFGYIREVPFRNVSLEFARRLMSRLLDVYPEVTRA